MKPSIDMDHSPKKKNKKPSSNFKEEIPEGRVPSDNHAVKRSADEDYDKKDPEFSNPAKQREESEQPVQPIKRQPINH